jgi:hypothetical protein
VRSQSQNPTAAPAAAASAPPYRYHSPAGEASMITLPFGRGIARMNEATTQPRAGRMPAL